jgi:hypothetical protein
MYIKLHVCGKQMFSGKKIVKKGEAIPVTGREGP